MMLTVAAMLLWLSGHGPAARTCRFTRGALSVRERHRYAGSVPEDLHARGTFRLSIDDAVRDHDVYRVIRERDIFQGSCRELPVLDVCLGPVYLGQGKHLVSQIKPAGRASAPGRQRHVHAAEVCLPAHRFCDHAGRWDAG
jgi:hypothetical protein